MHQLLSDFSVLEGLMDFGSFGLSTKEPSTTILCQSSWSWASLLVSSVLTPPSLELDIKLHIWYDYAHMPLVCTHQTFGDSAL